MMLPTRLRRRWCGAAGPRGWAALALATLAGSALLAQPPPPLVTEARFPGVAPRALAHALADFTNHPRLYPHLGEWTVEAESGNVSAWRYEVSYACGPRCAGAAAVLALDPAPPAPHTVLVRHRSCTRAPLPLLPSYCDEWETETAVWGEGGGAALRERALWPCGGRGLGGAVRRLLAAMLPGGRSCTQALRDARKEHMKRLRLLVPALI